MLRVSIVCCIRILFFAIFLSVASAQDQPPQVLASEREIVELFKIAKSDSTSPALDAVALRFLIERPAYRNQLTVSLLAFNDTLINCGKCSKSVLLDYFDSSVIKFDARVQTERFQQARASVEKAVVNSISFSPITDPFAEIFGLTTDISVLYGDRATAPPEWSTSDGLLSYADKAFADLPFRLAINPEDGRTILKYILLENPNATDEQYLEAVSSLPVSLSFYSESTMTEGNASESVDQGEQETLQRYEELANKLTEATQHLNQKTTQMLSLLAEQAEQEEAQAAVSATFGAISTLVVLLAADDGTNAELQNSLAHLERVMQAAATMSKTESAASTMNFYVAIIQFAMSMAADKGGPSGFSILSEQIAQFRKEVREQYEHLAANDSIIATRLSDIDNKLDSVQSSIRELSNDVLKLHDETRDIVQSQTLALRNEGYADRWAKYISSADSLMTHLGAASSDDVVLRATDEFLLRQASVLLEFEGNSVGFGFPQGLDKPGCVDNLLNAVISSEKPHVEWPKHVSELRVAISTSKSHSRHCLAELLSIADDYLAESAVLSNDDTSALPHLPSISGKIYAFNLDDLVVEMVRHIDVIQSLPHSAARRKASIALLQKVQPFLDQTLNYRSTLPSDKKEQVFSSAAQELGTSISSINLLFQDANKPFQTLIADELFESVSRTPYWRRQYSPLGNDTVGSPPLIPDVFRSSLKDHLLSSFSIFERSFLSSLQLLPPKYITLELDHNTDTEIETLYRIRNSSVPPKPRSHYDQQIAALRDYRQNMHASAGILWESYDGPFQIPLLKPNIEANREELQVFSNSWKEELTIHGNPIPWVSVTLQSVHRLGMTQYRYTDTSSELVSAVNQLSAAISSGIDDHVAHLANQPSSKVLTRWHLRLARIALLTDVLSIASSDSTSYSTDISGLLYSLKGPSLSGTYLGGIEPEVPDWIALRPEKCDSPALQEEVFAGYSTAEIGEFRAAFEVIPIDMEAERTRCDRNSASAKPACHAVARQRASYSAYAACMMGVPEYAAIPLTYVRFDTSCLEELDPQTAKQLAPFVVNLKPSNEGLSNMYVPERVVSSTLTKVDGPNGEHYLPKDDDLVPALNQLSECSYRVVSARSPGISKDYFFNWKEYEVTYSAPEVFVHWKPACTAQSESANPVSSDCFGSNRSPIIIPTSQSSDQEDAPQNTAILVQLYADQIANEVAISKAVEEGSPALIDAIEKAGGLTAIFRDALTGSAEPVQ